MNEFRRVTPFLRAMLFLGTFLVTLAGIQLYFLPTSTDRWFAWTIDVPMTAAFLGAFYWTSVPLALMSALRRTWAEARVGLVGVQVFLWMTLLTTLLHLDKFHFSSSDNVSKGAAWLWLVIYAIDPPLLTLAFILQVRTPGADPPRRARPPSWFRSLLLAQAVVTILVGIALFVAPDRVAAAVWPWPLTPLTARAVASWLLGLSFVLLGGRHENDFIRLHPATISYTVLGVLQGIAVLRFHSFVEWSEPKTWAYLLVLASVLVVGLHGWTQATHARRGDPVTA